MRFLAFAVLLACLVTPCSAAQRGAGAQARGALGSWAELSGAWDGTGTDAAGAYTMHANVETLFGGQYVLIQARETRGDKTHDNVTVFTGGEAPGAYIYGEGVPHIHLNGTVDAENGQVIANDAKLYISWGRGEGGTLTGYREEADADGNLNPVAKWELKRTSPTASPTSSPNSAPSNHRGTVEYFEFMDGTLKGEGLQAKVPGQMAADHFVITQVNAGVLNDTLLLTRETKTFDGGRVDESLQIHQVQNGAPVRHDFTSRGNVLEYGGVFNDIAQMRLNIDVPAGKLQIAVVATCSGFKTVNDLTRPGRPPVWVGEMQIKKVGHGK